MPSDPPAHQLLAAARRNADPVLAACMVAEAFFAMSRTADAATLAPLVGRLSALRTDPPAPQTEYLYYTLAGVVGVRARQPHATQHLNAALRIFVKHQLHTDALNLECAIMATLTLMRPHEVRSRFAGFLDQVDAEPDRRARLVAMIGLGDAWAGNLIRGRATLRKAHGLAHAAGYPDIQAEVGSWLIKIEALCGDLAASAAHLAEARDLAARTGSAWVACHIAECAAALHQARGDTESWVGVLEFLVGSAVGGNSGLIFEHRWELATHYALRGDRGAAEALLAGTPNPPLEWPGAPALPAWRGWIAQPTDRQAMAQFEESLAGLNRPLEQLSRARMAWLLGAQHARLGRRADATRLLEAASSGYATIGAAGPLAHVIVALQQVADGGSLQRVAPTPRSSQQPLTAAELRVAIAVADGLSNRAVAEQLLVSAKTIEFHLGNIFRKLGLRNRAELASLRGQLGEGSRLA